MSYLKTDETVIQSNKVRTRKSENICVEKKLNFLRTVVNPFLPYPFCLGAVFGYLCSVSISQYNY